MAYIGEIQIDYLTREHERLIWIREYYEAVSYSQWHYNSGVINRKLDAINHRIRSIEKLIELAKTSTSVFTTPFPQHDLTLDKLLPYLNNRAFEIIKCAPGIEIALDTTSKCKHLIAMLDLVDIIPSKSRPRLNNNTQALAYLKSIKREYCSAIAIQLKHILLSSPDTSNSYLATQLKKYDTFNADRAYHIIDKELTQNARYALVKKHGTNEIKLLGHVGDVFIYQAPRA